MSQDQCVQDFLERFEKSYCKFLDLKWRATRFLDQEAQGEMNRWIEEERPKLEAECREYKVSFNQEVSRITSFYKVS